MNVKNSVKYAYQMKQNLLKVNVVIIYVKIAFFKKNLARIAIYDFFKENTMALFIFAVVMVSISKDFYQEALRRSRKCISSLHIKL